MAGEVFTSLVNNLNNIGFYGFILPWMLVFAIVYGLLKKVKIIDDERINAVISIAIAFFVTAYSGIGTYFIKLSGVIGIVIAALLMVIIFFAVAGYQPQTFGTKWKTAWIVAIIVIALIVAWVLAGGRGAAGGVSRETWAAVFVVVMIVITVLYITGEKKSGNTQQQEETDEE